jgi:DNA-binding response OmpR family regulator
MGERVTLAAVKVSVDGAQEADSPRLAVGRVLVVDDIYDDAVLLADLLAPLNANVVAARSAGEALTIVDALLVDLVVTDLNMPGGSGLDLTRNLRRRRHVPAVIFLTASTLTADKVKAFELGAAAYLQKPVDCGYLIGLAREILRERRAQPANDPAARAQEARLRAHRRDPR